MERQTSSKPLGHRPRHHRDGLERAALLWIARSEPQDTGGPPWQLTSASTYAVPFTPENHPSMDWSRTSTRWMLSGWQLRPTSRAKPTRAGDWSGPIMMTEAS